MKRPWLGWLVVAAMGAASAALYTRLPAVMPSHWGLDGEVDGYSPRAVGAFLLPAIAAALAAGLPLLRRIDPRRENLERFAEFGLVVNLTVLFMAVLHAAILASSLGYPVDVASLVLPAVGLLLMGIGNYLPRLRSNFWMGVRTPWTLSSDRVWQRTHRVAGRVAMGCGAALVAASLLPSRMQPWVLLPAAGATAVVPVVYSYLEWRREMRGA